VIRVVLAVALAAALLGAALPVAERAERDRNAALATGELERLAERAERLAADNDPVAPGDDPAATTTAVTPPEPLLTDGGAFVVADDRLVWRPRTGADRSVESPVPLRVEGPITVTDRTRLRLSLVHVDGEAVVRVDRPKIEERSRDQTARVRKPPVVGVGLSL
jgi:hypothetical protein